MDDRPPRLHHHTMASYGVNAVTHWVTQCKAVLLRARWSETFYELIDHTPAMHWTVRRCRPVDMNSITSVATCNDIQ